MKGPNNASELKILTILLEPPSISSDLRSDQTHPETGPVSSRKLSGHCPSHEASHTKSLGFAVIFKVLIYIRDM